MQCLLPKDVNRCPHCDFETMKCSSVSDMCGFKEKETDIKEIGPSKKEKWYERYYQN